jgi:hypothetical protein
MISCVECIGHKITSRVGTFISTEKKSKTEKWMCMRTIFTLPFGTCHELLGDPSQQLCWNIYAGAEYRM